MSNEPFQGCMRPWRGFAFAPWPENTAAAAPDTAQVGCPGHAERTVRVAFVAPNQAALVEGDVGPVDDVVPVPDDGDGGVVLGHGGLVAEGCPVTDHGTGLKSGGDSKLGSLNNECQMEPSHSSFRL